MHLLLIIGGGGLAYLLLKKPAMNSSTVITVPNVPAPSPNVLPNQNVASEISALQAQVAALTPKAVDPLAPKVASPPLVNIFQGIQPDAGSDWQALQEAERSETNLNPRDFDSAHNARYCEEIKAGHTLAWNPYTKTFDNFEGGYQPGNALQLVGQGTSLGLAVTGDVVGSLARAGSQVAGSIASAIPFIGTAVSGLVGLFSAISAHHAAAVKAENTAYNNSLVTVENYMQIIMSAVESGQSTPDEGIAALDSMYSDFLRATPYPVRNNSPYCNGLCEAKIVVQGMVTYWKQYFNKIIASGNGLGNVVRG